MRGVKIILVVVLALSASSGCSYRIPDSTFALWGLLLSAGTNTVSETTSTNPGTPAAETTSCSPSTFTGTTTIESTNDIGYYSKLGIDGTNFYIAYYDSGTGEVKLKTSTDAGATWSAPSTVDDAGGNDVGRHLDMHISGSDIALSYTDFTDSTARFIRSTNGGTSWLTPVVVRSSVAQAETSLAISGTNAYLSYRRSGGYSISVSTDGGLTWPGSTVVLGTNSGSSSDLSADGTTVYSSYYRFSGDDLMFASSTDGGATFPVNGDVSAGLNEGFDNEITRVGSSLYISHHSTTGTQLRFVKSTDGGATWPTNLSVDGTDDVGEHSSIAVNGTNVYISYHNATNGNLKFARSTDGGLTWPVVLTVDNSANFLGLYTSIALYCGGVYISYYDSSTGDLKFAGSADDGLTW